MYICLTIWNNWYFDHLGMCKYCNFRFLIANFSLVSSLSFRCLWSSPSIILFASKVTSIIQRPLFSWYRSFSRSILLFCITELRIHGSSLNEILSLLKNTYFIYLEKLFIFIVIILVFLLVLYFTRVFVQNRRKEVWNLNVRAKLIICNFQTFIFIIQLNCFTIKHNCLLLVTKISKIIRLENLE